MVLRFFYIYFTNYLGGTILLPRFSTLISNKNLIDNLFVSNKRTMQVSKLSGQLYVWDGQQIPLP